MRLLALLSRPFLIKTRLEAFAVIYALAVGAVGRGYDYLAEYPGPFGYVLFAACCIAVFMAGAVILDTVSRRRRPGEERRSAERRIAAMPPG
jgi:hypothetical protein